MTDKRIRLERSIYRRGRKFEVLRRVDGKLHQKGFTTLEAARRYRDHGELPASGLEAVLEDVETQRQIDREEGRTIDTRMVLVRVRGLADALDQDDPYPIRQSIIDLLAVLPRPTTPETASALERATRPDPKPRLPEIEIDDELGL